MELENRGIKKVNINNVLPGMQLARSIQSEYGGTLIPEGTLINSDNMKKLSQLNQDYIFIYTKEEEEFGYVIDKKAEIKEDYSKKVNETEELFDKINFQGNLEKESINSLQKEAEVLSKELEVVDLLGVMRTADKYTYHHSLNVSILANKFGKWLGLDEADIEMLTQAGLLHDIGKTKVPDKILNKADELSEQEYQWIKRHSKYGYNMLKNSESISNKVAEAVLTHHERYDGSGYPDGLKGQEIPLFGRILAIVDTFDAITAERNYQKKSSPFKAIKVFVKEDSTHFDHKLKTVFTENIPNLFLQEKVLLSDGQEGRVVFINPRHPERPVIEVENSHIDLYREDGLEIVEIIN